MELERLNGLWRQLESSNVEANTTRYRFGRTNSGRGSASSDSISDKLPYSTGGRTEQQQRLMLLRSAFVLYILMLHILVFIKISFWVASGCTLCCLQKFFFFLQKKVLLVGRNVLSYCIEFILIFLYTEEFLAGGCTDILSYILNEVLFIMLSHIMICPSCFPLPFLFPLDHPCKSHHLYLESIVIDHHLNSQLALFALCWCKNLQGSNRWFRGNRMVVFACIVEFSNMKFLIRFIFILKKL